jgi:hypothetical protein
MPSDFSIAFPGGPIKRVKRESSVEAECVKAAVAAGWMHKKVGTNGWPDHLFLRRGRVVWVEFKRKGGKLRPGQERRTKELRENGFAVFVIDSKEAFERVVL